LSFALLVWEFVFLGPGGGVSFGWVRCVRYFGIEGTGASRQQAVWKFSFCPIFYRWIAVGAPGDVSVRALAADWRRHGNSSV